MCHDTIKYAYPFAHAAPLHTPGRHPEHEDVDDVADHDAEDEEGDHHQGQNRVREPMQSKKYV